MKYFIYCMTLLCLSSVSFETVAQQEETQNTCPTAILYSIINRDVEGVDFYLKYGQDPRVSLEDCFELDYEFLTRANGLSYRFQGKFLQRGDKLLDVADRMIRFTCFSRVCNSNRVGIYNALVYYDPDIADELTNYYGY